MGNLPILTAREVVRLLEDLGFREVRQRGSHKQFGIRMADARLFQFIRAVTYLLYYSNKSRKILV